MNKHDAIVLPSWPRCSIVKYKLH